MSTLSYRIEILGAMPGDAVDVYSSLNGERITSGVLDSSGNLILEYPATYGPAHAIVREPVAPQPWQPSTVYTRGDLVTSPHFGGMLLRCAINGTSGTTEPDDSQRMKGTVHRPVLMSRSLMTAYTSTGAAYGYGYSSIYSNTDYDGYPGDLDHTQRVEAASSEFGAYTLMSDGTVRVQFHSTTTERNNAHTEVQALNSIVKLWCYKQGMIALDTSNNLHHVCDYQRSTHKATVDNLLAANPTANRVIPGGSRGQDVTLLLPDGTAVSANSTLNGHLSGVTGIEAGAIGHQGLSFLLLCDNSTRLFVKDHSTPRDYLNATHLIGESDPVDEIVTTYGGSWAVTRSGSHFKFRNHSSNWYAQNFASYMSGKPTQNYIAGPAWADSETDEGVYQLTPRYFVSIQKTSFSSGPRHNIGGIKGGHEFTLGGHPIIRDAGVTWHLIEPRVRVRPAVLQPVSFDDTATTPVGTVSGTLAVDQAPAERPVLALAYKNGLPEVLASGASDENGDFSLTMPGHVEPVYLLAMDNAGPTWSAGASVTGGQRVIPTPAGHTGLVYECINDGVADVVEPVWPVEIGGVIIDGTISWEAISYFQPQAHGPVHPVVSGEPDDIEEGGNTYAYSEQTTADTTILQVFANTLDGSDLIYRRLIAPADIVDGDTWTYARTHDGGHFWADEYENTIDDTDLIYRLLDGSLISTQLPLSLVMPGGDFESLANWTDTTGVSVLKNGQAGPYDGLKFISGGNSPLTETYQNLDFADDVGLPAWAWHGNTLAVRWQQSSYSTSDAGQVKATFLDDQGADISTFTSSLEAATEQIWTAYSISAPVPANAVGLRIELIFDRSAGTNNDAYIDAMNLLLSA